jgi:hypothetical protein
MRGQKREGDYDMARMIAKCLYMGMALNVIIPVALLFVCYYIANNYFLENRLGDWTRPVFYVFGALGVVQSGLAIFWRGRRLNQPLIRRRESFESDLTANLAGALRPIFWLIALISVYGYVYFFLTGLFTETVFFVVLSFVVFQVVRPRYGFLEKVIARQEELVEKNRFFID